VDDIATETGLGIGSVRTYLKRIFYKTGARSQAALGVLLRGFN
jgi:DNA-binding CsgD family transcriptional regulator